MEQSFTPGPWKVRFMKSNDPEDGFFVQANRLSPEHPYDIEILGEDQTLYPTKLADAYLISSAPDMLAALLLFVDCHDKESGWVSDDIVNRAKAAINKALNKQEVNNEQ